MPVMPEELEFHDQLTPTERRVLHEVGRGRADIDVALELDVSLASVQSCLRRFRERTGLHGRLLVAWAVRHEECCITITG